jgi:hypothetical protein
VDTDFVMTGLLMIVIASSITSDVILECKGGTDRTRFRIGGNICSFRPFIFLYLMGLRALSGMIEMLSNNIDSFHFPSAMYFSLPKSPDTEQDSSSNVEMKQERADPVL